MALGRNRSIGKLPSYLITTTTMRIKLQPVLNILDDNKWNEDRSTTSPQQGSTTTAQLMELLIPHLVWLCMLLKTMRSLFYDANDQFRYEVSFDIIVSSGWSLNDGQFWSMTVLSWVVKHKSWLAEPAAALLVTREQIVTNAETVSFSKNPRRNDFVW